MKIKLFFISIFLITTLFSCSESENGEIVKVAPPQFFPTGGSYTQNQQFTINCSTTGADIYYTTDQTTPTTASIKYISPFSLPEGNYIIKAIAILGDKKSAVSEVNYTITIQQEISLTVYFKKPINWNTPVYIHYWNTSPEIPDSIWPGEEMENIGNNWFRYTIFDINSANIVFNDNNGLQSPDLLRDKVGWYTNGQWYNDNPDGECPACGTNAHCEGASCICDDGYEGDPLTECTEIVQTCDPSCGINAYCEDTICICSDGYEGDPLTECTEIVQTCDPSCGVNAHCEDRTCICDDGYQGDPLTECTEISQNCNPSCLSGERCINDRCVSVISRDFREENIYFIMTDRFYDGDTNNNNIWGDEYLPNGEADKYVFDTYKSGLLSYYHGGDFQGIIDKLDYLQEMGFTAIWITPVVKQPEGRYYNGGDYSASAFHGYWGYDFDKIDPHLHSEGVDSDGWDDFERLVKELHQRDMRLMLDIVTNHGHPGDPGTTPNNGHGYQALWSSEADAIIMDGETWYYNNDIYLDQSDDSTGFFNHRGDYKLSTLLDFNERGLDGEDAREHLINVYKKFLDYGVDAFRIDTVAYMTGEWWGEFSDEIYRYARDVIGNEHFYMVGEAWMGRNDGIMRMQEYSEEKKLHLLDLQGSCMDYPGELFRVFDGTSGWEFYTQVTDYGDQIMSDPTYMGVFVDNHDVYRANGRLNETQYKNALTYIYLFRGVPIIYYGTEAMYSWEGAHATTIKDDIVARWMLGSQGINYVQTNHPPLYKHIKMLNNLRLSSSILQKGVQENITMQGNKAIFKRIYQNKTAYIAMTNGSGYDLTFSDVESGTYRLITPNNSQADWNEEIVTITNGLYTTHVNDNSFLMLERVD